MLTLQDCLGICQLSEEEIEAIAEHEHIPDIVAIEIAEYLVQPPDGPPQIKRIIVDDIEHAESRGDAEKADRLRLVLKHFIATHPELKNAETPN